MESKKSDTPQHLKNPVLIAAGIAFLACMLPWVKMDSIVVTSGYSVFSLGVPLAMSDTILSPTLLYLLPLSLLGIIAGEFMPQLKAYQKIFILAAVGLVLYAGIGLYQLTHPATPEAANGDAYDSVLGMVRNAQHRVLRSAYAVGFGYYAALFATLTCLFFMRDLFLNKPEPEEQEAG